MAGGFTRLEALSEQPSVNRTPLRHALQLLAEDGLVETTGYKGARIARLDQVMFGDFRDAVLLEPLALKSAFRHHLLKSEK